MMDDVTPGGVVLVEPVDDVDFVDGVDFVVVGEVAAERTVTGKMNISRASLCLGLAICP